VVNVILDIGLILMASVIHVLKVVPITFVVMELSRVVKLVLVLPTLILKLVLHVMQHAHSVSIPQQIAWLAAMVISFLGPLAHLVDPLALLAPTKVLLVTQPLQFLAQRATLLVRLVLEQDLPIAKLVKMALPFKVALVLNALVEIVNT